MNRQNFKHTLSLQDLNQKQKETQKQQQNKLKELALMKRRKIENEFTKNNSNSPSPKDLIEIMKKTTDRFQYKDALKNIRKHLSIEEPPIDEFIDLGLISILKNILTNEKNYIELLYETLWCITSNFLFLI